LRRVFKPTSLKKDVSGEGNLDISKAERFVEANGTMLEKYRLHHLLGKERNDEIPLQHLRSLQNKDGGFPYNDERGKVSCVNATSNNLSLMIELKLDKSDVCRKAVEYILKIQGKDGSWSENEAITQYNPPFWDMPNDFKTTLWLTASITNYLIQLSYRKSSAVQKAASFLLKNRDNQGKFAGFLHTIWISIEVFGQLEGSNSDAVKRMLGVMEQNIEKLKDSAGDLAWCLECLYVAGVSKENALVRRCIEELVNLQQDVGSWKSGNGEEYGVSTTINALTVLKKYEVW